MIKKEKFMINMACHPMNKKVMKIWVSMETKEVFQIFLVLEISGEDKEIPREDLRVFLAISKSFLEVKKVKDQIDQ
jgi:hypothetical protein